MKSILDPSFHYRSAANTDLRKTFARVRRELKKVADIDQARREQSEREAAANVVPMQRKGTA